MKNAQREEVISLPLAPNSIETLQQELRSYLSTNVGNDLRMPVMDFLNRFSILDSAWSYSSCFICGKYFEDCHCNDEHVTNQTYYLKNHDPHKIIKLPLAENSTEEVQQELYLYIRGNQPVLDFLNKYSPLGDDWYQDQCYICGQFPNGCNCDGYYNVRKY